jgi:inhibitor of KinA sporulation pathway (predicted exonuclease)
MKINLANYLPVTDKEIDEFEQYVKHPTEKPSEEKFQKLMTKLKKKVKTDGKR